MLNPDIKNVQNEVLNHGGLDPGTPWRKSPNKAQLNNHKRYINISEYLNFQIFFPSTLKYFMGISTVLRVFVVCIVFFLSGSLMAQGQLAFPGAEGFGKYTKGGRGGKVIYVTNLNNTGSGSLREALLSSGPRTVVFKVGGTIHLQSNIVISNPFLTVAGQTAPGDGILIRGASVKIKTHEVIIRNLRFRMGAGINDDAITIASAGSLLYNIILDHCSISWSSDENMGINGRNGGLKDVTIQNCIIGEGILNHSMGLLVNKVLDNVGPDRISIHKNLFMSNQERNPMIGAGISCTVINNITHNWKTKGSFYDSDSYGDVMYNKYKVGVNTSGTHRALEIGNSNGPYAKVYLQGNDLPTGVDAHSGSGESLSSKAYFTSDIYGATPIKNIGEVENYVLSNAGTFPRDAVDNRLIKEYQNGTGKTISSESEVGGFPNIKGGTALKDTDGDGMPDDWEIANGLNPNVKDDAGDANKDGYTNIENYINCIFKNDCETSTPVVENSAPTISKIEDQSSNKDKAAGPFNFTIGDKETTASSLELTGISSNQTLVKNTKIQFSGTGSSRSVSITPEAGLTGSTTITLTVSDGTNKTITSFQLSIKEESLTNSAPSISSIDAQTTKQDVTTSPISFTISDKETSAGSLVVSGAAENQTLVKNTNIKFGGSGNNRTVTISPEPEAYGSTAITISVSDGIEKKTTSFTLNVEKVESKEEQQTGVQVLKINTGASQFTFNNEVWEADKHSSGGNTYTLNTPIRGTENDKLYQSERYGAVSYNVPVENGSYSVRLHFAEIYYGVKKNGGKGSRIFNVSIEGGQQKLTNYDIFAKVGAATAVIETFNNIKVTDGKLTIDLTKVVDNPKISAIEILAETTPDVQEEQVEQDVTSRVTSLTLIDATTDIDIMEITEGAVINLAKISGKKINIRANVNSIPIDKVVFSLNGSTIQTEREAPYAMFGDNKGDFNEGSLKTGNHSITATPYNKSDGRKGTAIKINFEVIDNPELSNLKINSFGDREKLSSYQILNYGPNPLNDLLFIKVQSPAEIDINIYIYNLNGENLKSTTAVVPKGESKIEINTSELSSGIYVLKLNHKFNSQSIKLIK